MDDKPISLRPTRFDAIEGWAEDDHEAAFGALLRGPEAAEAVAAFQEKRKPDFTRFFAGGKG